MWQHKDTIGSDRAAMLIDKYLEKAVLVSWRVPIFYTRPCIAAQSLLPMIELLSKAFAGSEGVAWGTGYYGKLYFGKLFLLVYEVCES